MKSHKIEIQPIAPADINEILDICDKAISAGGIKNICTTKNQLRPLQNVADWDISVKLTKNTKTIGCYIFSNQNSVHNFIDFLKSRVKESSINDELLKVLKNKTGIEGVAVCVLKEHRGDGHGKRLLNYPKKNMKYDYVWLIHTEGLSNMDEWLKRNELLATFKHDFRTWYVTVEIF